MQYRLPLTFSSANFLLRYPVDSAAGTQGRLELKYAPVSVDLVVNLSGEVRLVAVVREPAAVACGAPTSSLAPGEASVSTEQPAGDDVMEQEYMDLCRAARNKAAARGQQDSESPAADLLRTVSSSMASLSYNEFGDTFGEWEMVQDSEVPPAESSDRDNRGSKIVASILEEYSRDTGSQCSDQEDGVMDSADVQRRLGGLLRAMWEIQWPIPQAVSPEGRYATLLQISIGQEDVDEVITRDIHRTFPEHPQFGLEDVGQAALFNVLKAYSLHDLEVGYCQGMAFVAGVLLMYLPEEPAFQAFCDLMSSDGPDLRRLYLPGLEELKFQLVLFEHLLHKFHPGIAGHLKEHGIPPMLYASQWFLTAFACPFPTTFAARLIDVMLAEQNGVMLMRTALAVMAECEVEIVSLNDFEDIINHLKVEPCNWESERMREVLNVAVHSYLTEEDVREATELLQAEGGVLSPVATAPPVSTSAADGSAVAPKEEQGASAARRPEARTSPGGSAVERIIRNNSGQGDPCSTGVDLAAELETQMSDMNEEYMAMVLALDMMLDGGSTSGDPQSVSPTQ